MTIQKALDMTDRLKPNMMEREEKITFLNEIENIIYDELVTAHEPEGCRRDTRFLRGILSLIRTELEIAALQEKDDVVKFIDTARGKFHAELLKVQGRIPEAEELFLSGMENAFAAKARDAGQYTKAELTAFLEAAAESIGGQAPEQGARPAYDKNTDPGTELIVPAPDDMLYVYWLMCKIDHMNMEYDKFNNDSMMFQNAYDNASDRWTRHHMPVQKTREFGL